MFEWLFSHAARKVSLEEAERAKQEAVKVLAGRSEVKGIGIASSRRSGYSVKVNVSSRLPGDVIEELRRETGDVPILTEVIAGIVPY